MSVDVFWSSSAREVMYIIEAYQEKVDYDRRTFEKHIQTLWESARFAGFLAIKPHDTKNKKKTPQSIYVFPWEKDHKVGMHIPKEEAFTPEDTAELDRLKELYYAQKKKHGTDYSGVAGKSWGGHQAIVQEYEARRKAAGQRSEELQQDR